MAATASPWDPRKIAAAALALLVACFFVSFAWIGFCESDDFYYATAAQAWVGHWHVGGNHWALRHTIVLPMAAAFGLFGRSELALEAPILMYFAILLGMTFYAVRRLSGFYAGLVAVVLVAAIPVVATGASMVYTDLPETVFMLASVWLFMHAIQRRSGLYFVLSGVSAGLGMITRETSIVLVAFYGILFLANFGRQRANYFWIALGVLLVLGLDTAYLAGNTGDLMYRLHISQNGVKGDNPEMAAQFATQPGLDRFGTLVAPRWQQAWIMLFFNQNFGLMPLLAVLGGALLALRGPERWRTPVRLLLLLAAVWFVILSFVFTFLWLVPRYQILTACALVVPLTLWLVELQRKGYAWISAGVVVLLLGFGVLAIGVSDRNVLFGEKALAQAAAQANGPVLTDPMTLRGSAWLLDVNGSRDRVMAQAPQPGDLYFFYDRPRRGLPKDWPVQRPGADWVALSQVQEPPRPLTAVIFALGLDRVLPGAVVRKLSFQPRRAGLYRVPPASAAAAATPPVSAPASAPPPRP